MIFPRGGTGRTGFLTAGWFLVDFPLFGLPSDHALKLLERTLRRAGAGRQERPGLLLCIFGCSSASITSCWARNHIHFSSQDKAAYNISVIFHPSLQSHTLSIYYHRLYCLFQCKQPCSTAFIFPSLSPGFQARGALWKK